MRLRLRLSNQRIEARHRHAGSCVEARRQGVNLLLQLRHAAVRLLLALSCGHGDDAAAASLAASLAGLAVDGIRFAAHFQSATGLASSRFLRIGSCCVSFSSSRSSSSSSSINASSRSSSRIIRLVILRRAAHRRRRVGIVSTAPSQRSARQLPSRTRSRVAHPGRLAITTRPQPRIEVHPNRKERRKEEEEKEEKEKKKKSNPHDTHTH